MQLRLHKQERPARTVMERQRLCCWLLAGVAISQLYFAHCHADKVVFQFPEYDFKETSKNEITFREYESACDQSARCAMHDGIEKTRCMRECMSPSCYQEIYKFDELEEGEIDVRLNSFRACFMQRMNRNRG